MKIITVLISISLVLLAACATTGQDTDNQTVPLDQAITEAAEHMETPAQPIAVTRLEDFEWEQDDVGITITGYTGSGGAVTIPSSIHETPVIAIGDGAFSEKRLTSVTIPDSVTNISASAFFRATGLTSMKIPSNVKNIGEFAFFDCVGLSSVEISSPDTSIGDQAFCGCLDLGI